MSASLRFSTSCSSDPVSTLLSHEQRSTPMPESAKSSKCVWMQVSWWLQMQSLSITAAIRRGITQTLKGIYYISYNQLVCGEEKLQMWAQKCQASNKPSGNWKIRRWFRESSPLAPAWKCCSALQGASKDLWGEMALPLPLFIPTPDFHFSL